LPTANARSRYHPDRLPTFCRFPRGLILTSAIDVRGVGRRFGIRWALRGVTLDISAGEAVGLLGPNGSGKSTLLRILATLLPPSAGSASIDGLDVVRDAGAIRARVGFLAHTPGLYDDLTARENLRFAADMIGVPYAAAEENLARVGLAHVANERVRAFSAGMQRRLALARLTLHRPRVLLMDEPYSNLDAEGVSLVNSIVGDVVNAGGAALLVLHELTPASGVLDRTLVLADGRIAAPSAAFAAADRAASPRGGP
jgi:heme ABC exporter ATP-binding subunit CcmA